MPRDPPVTTATRPVYVPLSAAVAGFWGDIGLLLGLDP